MKQFMYLLIASAILSGCANSGHDNERNELKNRLMNRVNEYYLSWEKLDLEKMWEFWSADKVGSKQQFVEKWKNWNLRIKGFRIVDVQVSNETAKVKIEVAFVEHENEFTETSFDYWRIKNGNWELIDSGRKE